VRALVIHNECLKINGIEMDSWKYYEGF